MISPATTLATVASAVMSAEHLTSITFADPGKAGRLIPVLAFAIPPTAFAQLLLSAALALIVAERAVFLVLG
jgi:hypothetical protein